MCNAAKKRMLVSGVNSAFWMPRGVGANQFDDRCGRRRRPRVRMSLNVAHDINLVAGTSSSIVTFNPRDSSCCIGRKRHSRPLKAVLSNVSYSNRLKSQPIVLRVQGEFPFQCGVDGSS